MKIYHFSGYSILGSYTENISLIQILNQKLQNLNIPLKENQSTNKNNLKKRIGYSISGSYSENKKWVTKNRGRKDRHLE